jgi:cytochrome b involved in lipid metabolism
VRGGRTDISAAVSAAACTKSVRSSAHGRSAEGVEKVDMFGRRRRYFTMAEVARHNVSGDCWLVAHGKVYDASPFLVAHPGGEFAILRHAGTESTVDFDFHSSKAQAMWAQYLIGYVDHGPSRGSGECTIS